MDVWSSAGRGEDFGVLQGEVGEDIGAHLGCGGCGDGHDGHGGACEVLLEPDEFFVGGAEVVAPFAYAVGFVDGDAD